MVGHQPGGGIPDAGGVPDMGMMGYQMEMMGCQAGVGVTTLTSHQSEILHSLILNYAEQSKAKFF